MGSFLPSVSGLRLPVAAFDPMPRCPLSVSALIRSQRASWAFGRGGRQPSEFYGVHSIATDSAGNIYTTETWEGKRLQKFVNRGMAPVTTMHRGTAWPASAR